MKCSSKLRCSQLIKAWKIQGHAKEGSGHFVRQRLSAVALVVLFVFMLLTFASMVNAPDLLTLENKLANPLLLIGTALFVIIGFYHGVLGMQVIIDDYISDPKRNQQLMLIIRVAALFFGLLFLVSLAKLAF